MYTPGQLVSLLHHLPHVNISLQRLEDTRFRSDSETYIQSLAITGSVPGVCLILSLIILMALCLMTWCCDKQRVKVSLMEARIFR